MVILQGKGAAPGSAAGPLYRLSISPSATATDRTPEPRQAFLSARTQAIGQLEALVHQLRAEHNAEAAALFAAHIQLLDDPDYTLAVEEQLAAGREPLRAVEEAGRLLAGLFSQLDDPYMQERAADVLDVSRRIGSILSSAPQPSFPDTPFLLLAEDLSPSQLMQTDRSLLLGIATEAGSPAGHTAILARTLGIPAVMALGALPETKAGCPALVDGDLGQLVLEPDTVHLARIEHDVQTSFPPLPDLPVRCNISSPADIPQVLACAGEGVGLFRSEFLFLGTPSLPGEDVQYHAYRQVLEGLSGQPVTIRTCDLGADKIAPFLSIPHEENPALGLRGLRLGLYHPELLRTQLRALYRASVHGNLSILFPMVSNLWEVEQVKALCTEVREELRREDIPVAPHVPIGIMIETPAAALLADQLAKAVDFFSIGTNDLLQYTSACDRQNPGLDAFCPSLHPALLRLVEMTVTAAHGAGIPVCVCGDLASDPEGAAILVALGADELSVPPRQISSVRQALHK